MMIHKNILKLNVILAIALISISFLVGCVYGNGISLKVQLGLYKTLREISSIIFAVIGAWIAIIFPGALTKIFKKGISIEDKSKEVLRVKLLIQPMILSTISIIISVFIEFSSPIIKSIKFFTDIKGILLSFSYGLLASLFLLEVWCLIMALIPTQIIIDDLTLEIDKSKCEEAYSPNIKKKNPTT